MTATILYSVHAYGTQLRGGLLTNSDLTATGEFATAVLKADKY